MKWAIVVLILFSAGWMFADGLRAFVVGDYLTPKSGEYAGQLGPLLTALARHKHASVKISAYYALGPRRWSR